MLIFLPINCVEYVPEGGQGLRRGISGWISASLVPELRACFATAVILPRQLTAAAPPRKLILLSAECGAV